MKDDDFNPSSVNAMLATILGRLDQQDRVLGKIETQTTLTNGRVTKIEQWIMTTKAKIAAVVVIGSVIVSASAWIIERIF